MSISMREATKAVKSMFEENEWTYDYDADSNKFTAKFNLSKTKLGSVEIRILVRASGTDADEARMIISHGFVSLRGDSECMPQLGEYLTRANYGLNYGNFEFDCNDGEIRYKVALNCVDALPGRDALEDLCVIPAAMFNKYGNGMLAVSMGMMSAKDACAQAEI